MTVAQTFEINSDFHTSPFDNYRKFGRLKPVLLAFLILPLVPLKAQKFWLTTYEFVLGPKTGIASQGDSTLFVSSIYGMIKSTNRGQRFDTVLLSTPLHSLLAMKNGLIIAGGQGKIFRSQDYGTTWDSISLGVTFPVHQLIESTNGDIFGITASYENGYEGAGVFHSPDGGITWAQQNTGLQNYLCIERIASDKNGRLYIAAADESASGNAGLFISGNNGSNWQHLDIWVNTDENAPLKIKVSNTAGLSISPADTLYYSLNGVAANFAVYGNLKKHINNISDNSPWTPEYSRPQNYWWENPELNNIHFARNGDQYSSFHRLRSNGGTYYKKPGTTWQNTQQGLGYDVTGSYNIQRFTEMPDGTIYMVQAYDERVYVSDLSVITSIPAPEKGDLYFKAYPNPVWRNNQIHIEVTESQRYRLTILNMQGQILSELTLFGNASVQSPAIPGMYLIKINFSQRSRTQKIIVE